MSEGMKILRIGGVTLAVYLGMKYLLPYVLPFLIAYALVHVLNPLTEKIQKKLPWKKEALVSILLVALLALFSLLFYYLSCLLTEQIRKIAQNFDYYYSCFCGIIDECCLMAEKSFGVQVEEVKQMVYSSLDEATEQIRVYLVPGVVKNSVKYLKKIADAGLFLLMIFVAAVLLMKDYDRMKESLQKYSLYQHSHRVAGRMWKQGGMYLKAQAIIILVVMVICALGLWFLGNPYFLVLGILIGLVDVLPFIGTGTVLVPMAAYYLFRRNISLALGHLVLFLVTYVAREFLEPRLIGAKLGIYPFVMVVVVYIGLYLYGPTGVLLGPVSLLAVMEIVREMQMSDG